MKTIAISIDESTLRALDALAKRAAPHRGRRIGRGHRSALVRRAVSEFIARCQAEEREAHERVVLARYRKKLAQQTKALLSEQAEP